MSGDHGHAELASVQLLLSETSARQTQDAALQASIDALTARVAQLEGSVSPPAQVIHDQPVAFAKNGDVIADVSIDIARGQPMTIAKQAGQGNSVYGKGYSGCTLRNVTLRGREWGALLVDMNDMTLDNVTVLDVNYCGIAIFGGLTGKITNSTVQRVGMLRDSSGNPSIGDPGNAYGIKFEVASQAGGSSNVPTDWLADHNLIEDSPLWMGINAHQGVRLTVTHNIVRRAPRAYFFAGPMQQCIIDSNLAEQPVTKAGGTTDIESYLYSGWVSGSITNNRYGTGYPGPTKYGTSGPVTVSGNVPA